MRAKRIIFLFAAFGCGAAGAITMINTLTVTPNSIFGVQWTAYMIFMVLLGGLGTFEGPVLGALVLFGIQQEFQDQGAGIWSGSAQWRSSSRCCFLVACGSARGALRAAPDAGRLHAAGTGPLLGGVITVRGLGRAVQDAEHGDVIKPVDDEVCEPPRRDMTQQLLIGGSWVDATSGRTFEQTFPFTGETAGQRGGRRARGRPRGRGRGLGGVRRVVAQRAGAAARGARKAADILASRAEEIAGIVTEETGGVFGWGMFNVAAGRRDAAGGRRPDLRLTGEVIPSDVPGKLAMAVRQPAGVVVAIAPWNAPVILATRAVATPIAYGNTVVLKGSEICPRTHAAMVRALDDAGLPDGVINF